MKEKIKIIATGICLAMLIVIVTVSYVLLVVARNKHTENYSIVVEDNITVYFGDEYTLVPYLVKQDGTIEESRFQYTPSTNDIQVSEKGVITIKSIPQNEVKVDILERNTQVSTQVKVNVVSELSDVLGITINDGSQTECITSDRQLEYGKEYELQFVTEPRRVEVEYQDIQITDKSGNEKDVIDISFDGRKAKIKTKGLGKGEIKLNIVDKKTKKKFEVGFDYTINLQNRDLGEAILSSAKKELMTEDELNKLETVTIGDNITIIAQLSKFEKINTIVISSDKLQELSGVSEKYCYRVKEEVYYDYIQSEEWGNLVDLIIPYKNRIDEIYVIYHNAKEEDIEKARIYEQLTNDYTFPSFQYKGYIIMGWTDRQGNEVTVEDIKDAKQHIHLYAQVEPIKYTVKYMVRGEEDPFTESWNYETESKLKNLSEVSDKTITGYKFIGWTTDESIELDEIEFDLDTLYSKLTTVNDGEVILYDVWAPITYILRFESDDKYAAQHIDDVTLKYNQPYSLPSCEAKGYNFKNWVLKNNSEVTFPAEHAVKELTAIENDIVILVSAWTEKEYIVQFDLGGGNAVDGTELDTIELRLSYMQEYSLKQLIRAGYISYIWYLDTNNNGEMDENEPSYDMDATVSKLSDGGNVILRVIWEQAVYTVCYDLDGGDELLNGTDNISYKFEETITMPSALKTGYTLTGWVYNNKIYEIGCSYSKLTYENEVTVTLIAQWRKNTYLVTYDFNDGLNETVMEIRYDTEFTLPSPTIVGYDFSHWEYGEQTFSGGATIKVNKVASANQLKLAVLDDNYSFTLLAKWTPHTHKVTKSVSNATITVKDKNGNVMTSLDKVAYGTTLYVTVTYSKSKNKKSYCE